MTRRKIHQTAAVLLACLCMAGCEDAEAKRQAGEQAAADSAEAVRLRRNEASERRAADLRAERARWDAQKKRDKALRDAMHAPVETFQGSQPRP